MRLSFLPLVLIIASPAIAHADDINGGTPTIEIWLPELDGDDFEFVAPGGADRRFEHQFNQARCLCAASGVVSDVTQFAIHPGWSPAPTPAVTESIEVWTGVGCDTATGAERAETCGTAAKATTTSEDIQMAEDIPLTTIDLIDAAVSDPRNCGSVQGDRFVYFVYNPSGSAEFDAAFPSTAIPVDTKLPDAPTKFTAATGGEEALTISWPVSTTSSGVYYYQALCAKVDASDPRGYSEAFTEDVPAPKYETFQQLCNGDQPPLIDIKPVDVSDEVDGGTPAPSDGGVEGLPDALADLDKDFICGEATSTQSTIRIEGLENGAEYHVVLLAIDEAGNTRGITPGFTMSPQPATDFWEDLHSDENGSDAKGGFCLIADTYGDRGGPGGMLTDSMRTFRDQTLASSGPGRALTRFYYAHVAGAGELAREHAIARVGFALLLLPLVALALIVNLLSLPGTIALIGALWAWRKHGRTLRLRPAFATAGALVALFAGSHAASAQAFAPYWDDGTDDATDVADGASPTAVKWHVGIKLGPYLPGIDEQLGKGEGQGPYHLFFGGYNMLPVLEVDWIVWHPPGGQLGIGGSGGVLGKTGQALDMRGNPSEGDQTKFRLLPLAANAVYRFTMLDDEYGIPVVPYLRAGLAYYVWWITKPSGDIAVTGMGNKARGASLGLQGSAGLAIRAEQIDSASAASMRDSGIFHAGFYGEYQVGWVDGFGSDEKLAVGDATWFAGVDFEF